MAAGGISSVWLMINRYDMEGVRSCGKPEHLPQRMSDSL
jgi:hypothetical protein